MEAYYNIITCFLKYANKTQKPASFFKSLHFCSLIDVLLKKMIYLLKKIKAGYNTFSLSGAI